MPSVPGVHGNGERASSYARVTYVSYVASPPAERPAIAGMPTATSSSAYSTITAPRRARAHPTHHDGDPPGFTRATNLPMEVRSQRNSEEQSGSKAKPRQRGFLHCRCFALGRNMFPKIANAFFSVDDQLALVGKDRGSHRAPQRRSRTSRLRPRSSSGGALPRPARSFRSPPPIAPCRYSMAGTSAQTSAPTIAAPPSWSAAFMTRARRASGRRGACGPKTSAPYVSQLGISPRRQSIEGGQRSHRNRNDENNVLMR